MDDLAIDLEAVTVMKSGRELISAVDWQVRRGDKWVLFGPNGSGKTTLLQIVSTYQFPARGTARVLGTTFGKADVRQIRPRIGYVGPAPQALIRSHLPCRDIVVTGRHAAFVDTRWHDYTATDWESADRHLLAMGMGDFGDREFRTLSEGEKRRVLISRALAAEPDLLLLDEPGTGLDLGAREGLVLSLSSVAGELSGTTMILVTHHVEEIPPGFDQILVLADGRAAARGPIGDVLTSDELTRAYGMPLRVERQGGRFRAFSVPI